MSAFEVIEVNCLDSIQFFGDALKLH